MESTGPSYRDGKLMWIGDVELHPFFFETLVIGTEWSNWRGNGQTPVVIRAG